MATLRVHRVDRMSGLPKWCSACPIPGQPNGYDATNLVVVSVEQYEHLVRSARRREAVAEALASVRAEVGEPSVETLAALERLARGDIHEDKLLEQLRRRYQH